MTDVGISVAIIPDDSGARVIKRALDDVGKGAKTTQGEIGRLSTTQKGLNAILAEAVSPLEKLRAKQAEYNLYLRAGILDQENYAIVTRKNQLAIAGLNAETKLTNQILGQAKGLFLAYFGAQVAAQLIKTADAMSLMRARLQGFTGDVAKTDRLFQSLENTADSTGQKIGTTLDTFLRLKQIQSSLKATDNQLLAFTDNVAKLGVASGAGPQALESAMVQMGQLLSSNKARTQEWRTIMDQTPAIGAEIAKQLGVSTAEMGNLIRAGKVLSSDVFAAIVNATDDANRKFAQMPETAGRGLQQLQNSFAEIVDDINRAVNGSNALGETLNTVGQAAKTLYDGLATLFDGLVASIQEAVNAITIGINKVLTLSNQYLKTDFNIDSTVDPGSIYSSMNTARKQREAALFNDVTPKANPAAMAYSQDYTRLAKEQADKDSRTKEQREAERKAIAAAKRQEEELTSAINGSRTQQEKLNDEIEHLEKLKGVAKTAEQVDLLNRGIANTRAELDKVRVQAELDSPLGQAFKRLAGEIDDGFHKAWTSAFSLDKNGSIFKRMLDGMKQMFVNFLADLSYQALICPVVVSVIGAGAGAFGISKGAQASVLGTAGNAVSGGTSLFSGLGSLLSTGYSPTLGKIGGFIGSKIGGFGTATQFQKVFGNSAYGGLGSLGAQLLGLGSGNTIVDSGLGIGGSLLGSALGGPFGSAIGGFLGTALGGLFGGAKPSDKEQHGGINLANLAKYQVGGMTGSKYSAENAKFRNSVLGEASNLAQLFQSVGGTTSGRVFVTVGSRDGLRLGTGNNTQNFGNNSAAFVAAVMQQVVKGTTGLNETFTKILQTVGVRDTKKLGDAFAFGQSYLDAINPKTPAQQLADGIKAVNDQFAGLLKTATDLGLPIEEYSKALDKQKDAAIGALKAQQAGFSSLEQMTSAFDDFFTSQALGSNSSLNPMDKLQVAQNNFGSLLAKAQGGDLSVTPNLLNAANTLLDVGRSTYASGVDFTGIESFVKSSVQGVAQSAGYSGQNVSYSIISTNQLVSNNIVQMNAKIDSLTAEIFRLTNKLAAA